MCRVIPTGAGPCWRPKRRCTALSIESGLVALESGQKSKQAAPLQQEYFEYFELEN